MYIYMCTYIHVSTCIFIYMYINNHIHMTYVDIYMYTCIKTHISIYIYIYIYIYTWIGRTVGRTAWAAATKVDRRADITPI